MGKKELKKRIDYLENKLSEKRAQDFELVESILKKYGELTVFQDYDIDSSWSGINKITISKVNKITFSLDY